MKRDVCWEYNGGTPNSCQAAWEGFQEEGIRRRYNRAGSVVCVCVCVCVCVNVYLVKNMIYKGVREG